MQKRCRHFQYTVREALELSILKVPACVDLDEVCQSSGDLKFKSIGNDFTAWSDKVDEHSTPVENISFIFFVCFLLKANDQLLPYLTTQSVIRTHNSIELPYFERKTQHYVDLLICG